jgi:hypothetical protein
LGSNCLLQSARPVGKSLICFYLEEVRLIFFLFFCIAWAVLFLRANQATKCGKKMRVATYAVLP